MRAVWQLAEKVQVQALTGGLQSTWATRRLCFWGQASCKKGFCAPKLPGCEGATFWPRGRARLPEMSHTADPLPTTEKAGRFFLPHCPPMRNFYVVSILKVFISQSAYTDGGLQS